mmetsp:Transcript_83262/g.269355  ORF Transcript_83262/g.269355 Transcript_83262/m.269355 type:complete len:369 (+) Transcript_83262:152-1258(+)
MNVCIPKKTHHTPTTFGFAMFWYGWRISSPSCAPCTMTSACGSARPRLLASGLLVSLQASLPELSHRNLEIDPAHSLSLSLLEALSELLLLPLLLLLRPPPSPFSPLVLLCLLGLFFASFSLPSALRFARASALSFFASSLAFTASSFALALLACSLSFFFSFLAFSFSFFLSCLALSFAFCLTILAFSRALSFCLSFIFSSCSRSWAPALGSAAPPDAGFGLPAAWPNDRWAPSAGASFCSGGHSTDTVSRPSRTGSCDRRERSVASRLRLLAELVPKTRVAAGISPSCTFITPSAHAAKTSRSRTLSSTQIFVVGITLPGTEQQMASNVFVAAHDNEDSADFRFCSVAATLTAAAIIHWPERHQLG